MEFEKKIPYILKKATSNNEPKYVKSSNRRYQNSVKGWLSLNKRIVRLIYNYNYNLNSYKNIESESALVLDEIFNYYECIVKNIDEIIEEYKSKDTDIIKVNDLTIQVIHYSNRLIQMFENDRKKINKVSRKEEYKALVNRMNELPTVIIQTVKKINKE